MAKRGTCATAKADLEMIARRMLGFKTLKSANSDRLDFHEVGVGNVKKALVAAFTMGQRCGLQAGKRRGIAQERMSPVVWSDGED